jgi:SAM-dependent methyltransferase
MKWVAKAALQRAIGFLPGAERINYQFQRHVTRQLPRSDQQFRLHATQTIHHFNALRSHAQGLAPAEAQLYEFGAGWDLITPVVFYGFGINHQTLVDLEAHLRLADVNHTLSQYRRLRGDLEEFAGVSLREIPCEPLSDPAQLRERFGISYLAPCDARDTALPADSFDFVSNTFTLEHIPRPDIVAILVECRRLLKPGGLISCSVDMQDHYSFFDKRISVYNFLKFSDRTWRLVNSPLHFQNRLRARDYRTLLAEAGFEPVAETLDVPGRERLRQLASQRLSPRFQCGYSADDLAPSWIRIIGRSS